MHKMRLRPSLRSSIRRRGGARSRRRRQNGAVDKYLALFHAGGAKMPIALNVPPLKQAALASAPDLQITTLFVGYRCKRAGSVTPKRCNKGSNLALGGVVDRGPSFGVKSHLALHSPSPSSTHG